MADTSVENYKKSVQRAVERFGQKVDKLAKELAPITKKIDELEAIEDPSDEDTKRIEELKKKRAVIAKKGMEKAAMELKADLMLLPVPPKADEKELAKSAGWLQEIIKKKGIPLSEYVTLVPDASFDFKAKKLKSFDITLKWEW